MRLLLDTQAFLWFEMDSPRLSANAKTLIEDPDNDRFLSMASVWEMAIKLSLAKLTLSRPIGEFVRTELQRSSTSLFAVELRHPERVAVMPFHHRDPFDRLIAAQGLVENMPIVSVDTAFDAYGVERLW